MKKKFTLSDQQKEWIEKNGESLQYDVKDITVTITGDKSKDGRSAEGVAVKKFLSEDLNVKPKVRSVISSGYDALELNAEQRKFLREKCKEWLQLEFQIVIWLQLGGAKVYEPHPS